MDLKPYLGIKQIYATPMVRSDFNRRKGWESPSTDEAGYFVVYPDGYESWSPKEIFEASYLPLEIADKITDNVVRQFIGESKAQTLDTKTTLVKVETVTGFLLYEASSCVDPANYDENVGFEIGMNRIKNKLWEHLGFVLQWARFGIKKS